ncbi:MAG: helix-turn-helix transcriptional regulator, partial [Rhodospirillales bacterium]
LSPREAAVAASLGGGRTIVETAGSLGISEETARKYTKSIYQKTGLRNQAELVAAAWRVTR